MDDGQGSPGRERPRLARGTAQTAVTATGARRARVAQTMETSIEPRDHLLEAAALHPRGAPEEPARTIHEAIERWILAHEADEAVAEWSHARA